MAWQIEPDGAAKEELERIGEFELRSLMSEVHEWLDTGDWEDMAIARGIMDRGYSEPFAYWLLKEMQVRYVDEKRDTA
jgi:hypothetical protein